MTVKTVKFQRGVILKDVVVGAFRANGTTLHAWCAENGVGVSSAQSALIGRSGGVRGHILMERMIEAAGREYVEVAYAKRVEMHAAEVAEARVALARSLVQSVTDPEAIYAVRECIMFLKEKANGLERSAAYRAKQEAV